jgi:hypothetical protein
MIRTLYILFGLIVLGTLFTVEYRGWSLDTIEEVKNVPKSVRDNPGSYRSVYNTYHHYTGGK